MFFKGGNIFIKGGNLFIQVTHFLCEGDLLCWLRLGWLDRVYAYSRNRDASICGFDFRYARRVDSASPV